MPWTTRILVLATIPIALTALPTLAARAQGASPESTSACPSAGPGTEIPLGADSVSRRPAPSDSASRTRSGVQPLGTAPDIILRASVSAREVRFGTQPHITVRLCGGTLDSVRVVERRNLPTPVVAGTTYRDVYVAVEILGHLTASCISNAVTGGRAAPATTNPCASLGITDSASARRVPPARRPQ